MRVMLLLVMVAILAAPRAVAHEGHDHKIMGTVVALHENHLEVKATDGKSVIFSLHEKVKVLRGRSAADTDTIKVGERIVVTATQVKGKDGKPAYTVKQINLAASGGRSGR